ncbi:MAG: NAD(P)-dependent oxidoreductase [Solirubrobacterales bacterium]|nr:NAD(P)-dependent oxidoreductase [Solirubrobacterales bacterium]
MNVGFIGLGRMGSPMAHCLLRAGFPLTVYNRTHSRALLLGNAGAAVAESPAEATRAVDVVVTMLADDGAVFDVVDGSDGLLAGARPGQVLIEMSTIGPDAARELADRAARCGVVALDAPVSGSVPAAEAATLVTVVGGDRDAFEAVCPVLAAMTRTQMWMGASGAGAAMKLALTGMIAATNEALSEALVISERSGIVREAAYEAIAASAVGSRFVEYKRAAFLDPGDEPVAFTLALMQKDLTLYLALARRLGVPVPGGAAADQMLTAARASEGEDADFAMVAAALRGIARTAEEAKQ